MAALFNRSVAVTLAKPLEGKFFGERPNAVVITDLRVQFVVEKNLRSEPNTCDVTITNLSERSRSEAQAKPLYARLDAGYAGNLERLFTGDLRWGVSTLDGVDWNTKLQLGDGDRAFRFARVNRSFKGGVDARTAILETAHSMGLTAKFTPAAERELRAQFAGGLALTGPAQTELTRLLGPFGMSWSIQDGTLQILRAGEHRANAAIVISQDEGMIGSPEYGAPTKKHAKPTLSVSTMLQPAIVPGGLIAVTARNVKGTFRVERVTHRGDTHGDDWQSDVEATPV